MALDPYTPCPCGSGKKFKWCCQPISTLIDKAFQLDAEGQHEMALRTMEQVAAEHPDNPEVWGRKAQLLYQMDKVEEAEEALEKAFALNPNYPFGHYLRGRFRHFEGEVPGAVLLFRKAAELYDPIAGSILGQIHALIAECELKLNRPVAARAALLMAVKYDPANADYRSGVEQVFGKESRLPEAARKEYTYQALPASAGHEPRAAWEAALQVAGTGKLSDVGRAFEQLTHEQPEESAAWFNLGLTRAWQGDNGHAVDALDRSVQLDRDEGRAARTWALAEVLLCGFGLEERADYVEHTANFPIRNPEMLVKLLHDLEQERRLIGVQARQEDGVLTGILVEKVQGLTPEHAASQMPRLGAYFMIIGDLLRLWNVNAETFDAVTEELRRRAGPALGEPYLRPGPAHFADVLAEAMAFPVHATSEAEGKQLMQEYQERFLEDRWIHKPLRSLNQVPPVDAAGHPALRKKLLGVIQFLQDCTATIGWTYDFDRLRRKLGLRADAAAAPAVGTGDIGAMGAAELANLNVDSLGDEQLDLAHQTAVRLDAHELAGKFAQVLVARPPAADRGDRYNLFNQLVQQALARGDTTAALDWINAGEKSDCEHNEGRRRNDYELRRGQVHAKRGEVDDATEVFERLFERAPTELRYRGSAAEALLSARQPARALHIAESGLARARQQNDRDSEQYFLELAAAARKQGA
jgi:tetratricopeptide (TPR) repeat protein